MNGLDLLQAAGAIDRPLAGVREYAEGEPVEIRRLRNGRVAVVAWAECGNRATEVDLFDLIDAMRSGPVAGRVPGGFVL